MKCWEFLFTSFDHLKVTNNAQKDKWNINELILICVQIWFIINLPKFESLNITVQSKLRWKANKNYNSSKKTSLCYFYSKTNHLKKGCPKYKAWLKKKIKWRELETNETQQGWGQLGRKKWTWSYSRINRRYSFKVAFWFYLDWQLLFYSRDISKSSRIYHTSMYGKFPDPT